MNFRPHLAIAPELPKKEKSGKEIQDEVHFLLHTDYSKENELYYCTSSHTPIVKTHGATEEEAKEKMIAILQGEGF